MKKGKETVDLSQLPPVAETISSIIFNFENTDKKLKIIESFYKMPEKELKMISREEIILFAKDQKIYIDPAEGKKPAKGEPPIEHKPITPQELAKAAKLLIDEFDLPGGLDVKLSKNIPIAAGLAGGSGNAAAVMKAVNELFDLGLSVEDLKKRESSELIR